MDDLLSKLEAHALVYAKSRGITIDCENPLGFGTDGCVWKTSRKSAVKVFEREANYQRERDCYQRLKSRGMVQIGCFEIPRLMDCDDELLVVEMGIVAPPFLLDFAKAYLDRPPDFSPEVMAEWEEQQVEWHAMIDGDGYLKPAPRGSRAHARRSGGGRCRFGGR
jgi:hypothetical protein